MRVLARARRGTPARDHHGLNELTKAPDGYFVAIESKTTHASGDATLVGSAQQRATATTRRVAPRASAVIGLSRPATERERTARHQDRCAAIIADARTT